MTDKYILKGRDAAPCDDLMTWARWFEDNRTTRHVANDYIAGDVRVSTVFLGLDHNYGGGPPLIFESMIFGGPHDGEQRRYSTWDEAEKGHAELLALAKASIN